MPAPSPDPKLCRKCGEYKPWSDFYVRKQNGRPYSYCKHCMRTQVTEATRMQRARLGEDEYAAHRRAITTEWARNNRQRVRHHRIMRQYGISAEEYDELKASAHGACSMCGAADRPLHLDHDHRTGVVRAFVCQPCNTIIGMADDSVQRLELAIAYLQRHAQAEAC